jgi:hypothetical protein
MVAVMIVSSCNMSGGDAYAIIILAVMYGGSDDS